MPAVDINLVDNKLSEDVWHMPYMEFFLNQAHPEDPKLQAKMQWEAWNFKVIYDSVGSPNFTRRW